MDLELLENFAFGDRKKALEGLVPGTEDYFHRACLLYEHERDRAKLDATLATWIERHGRTERVVEIERRRMFLRFDDDPTFACEQIRQDLGFSFDHQRAAGAEEVQHPSRLDPELISRETLLKRINARSRHTLEGFSEHAHEWLMDVALLPERKGELLDARSRPDHPKLVDFILSDLGRKGVTFGTRQIHSRLTLEQLVELAQKLPRLLADRTYVAQRVWRLRPDDDTDIESDPRARLEHLERLWAFVSTLQPSFNSLKANVLYHRLVFDRSLGIHDRARFLTYLALPRSTSYYKPEIVNKRELRDQLADLRAQFNETSLSSPGDDEALVIAYLEAFFATDEHWEDFQPYLRDDFLRRVFATTKLLTGRGDPERWAEMLDDAAGLQALKDRVEIELAPTNPTHYRATDPVTLAVDVKNVRTLIVKVFELDALNYFLTQKSDVQLNVDLDGLVANWEVIHKYDESPYRRVRRELSLPELSRGGVFVVELIGNGRSSRALIRKGELRLAERTSAAGHAFTIFGDDDRPAHDATLWLAGREYRAKDGELVVPFTTDPKEEQVLLRRGDISSPASFRHQAENYALSVGFHVDREQLVANEEATLIVRPQLRLNGVPVGIELLEQRILRISSEDHSGIVATREMLDVELSDEKDLTIPFLVPEGLRRLTFELRGKVRVLSRQLDQELFDRTSLELNAMYLGSKIEAFHLAETADGWIAYFLGKTGEPRAQQAINFAFSHRSFTETVQVTLQTDRAGRVELGALTDIEMVEVSSASGVEQRWLTRRRPIRFPQRVHGRARVPMTVAFVGLDAKLDRAAFALLEKRWGSYAHDRFDDLSLSRGWLQISGLAPGDYELVAKEHNATIELAISGGEERDGWLVSNARRLEAADRKPLGFDRLELTKSALEIQLGGFDDDTRVHVFAVRLVPAFRAFDTLGRVFEPFLRAMQARRPRSDYVSGRDIGDEYRYVLERRHAPRVPGNMLPRPGLLLNPWAVRSTSMEHQQAAAGGAYGAPAAAPAMGPPMAKKPKPAGPSAGGDFPILDFLRTPGVVLANLVPDEKGRITVPREKLGAAMALHVLAVDAKNAIWDVVKLPETKIEARDLRLHPGLDPAGHFLVRRQVTPLVTGERLVIEDLSTAKLELFDTLARVHRLFQAIEHNSTLAQFNFILEWPKLDEATKRAKYSELACHELSFFLSKKDPAFFEAVIRPYLANKLHKTFVDEFLLREDLSRWLEPWAYGRLNTVERILLGERIAEERAATARAIQDRFELIPPDPERDDRLFRSALSGRALEGGGGAGLAASIVSKSALPEMRASAGEDYSEVAAPMADLYAAEMDDSFDGEMAKEEEAAPRDEPVERERGRARKMKKADVGRRAEARAFYRQIEKTEEWAENNYWHQRAQESLADQLPINAFWRDYAKRDPARPFLSGHFPEATENFTEMMFALSVLDLPFDAGLSPITLSGTKATIDARAPLIVFHEEIKPSDPPSPQSPLLVGQRYIREDDPWIYEGGEQTEKYVTGELLTHVVYTCKVVLTNPSSSRQKLDVLLQIPRGAVPVERTQRTKTEHVVLGPYSTHPIAYGFYFPLPGNFTHFPVHATKGGVLMAAGQPAPVEVIDRPRVEDTTSWAYVSQHAKPETVLDYLDRENLERVDLEQIAWRMRDRGFWSSALIRLSRRRKYDRTAWSYALFHQDRARTAELLRHESYYLRGAGLDLESPLLSFEPVARAWYEHLEYAPLVHARAHRLGASRRILNTAFAGQYAAFLELLAHRVKAGDGDLLEAAYYLLLQDRFDEAAAMFRRVGPNTHAVLESDYLHAHLLLSEGAIARAKELGQKHKNHPVDRWRKLFQTLLAQLEEIEGAMSVVVDRDDRGQKQDELASTQPAIDFAIDGGKLEIHYQNLNSCRISYHVMDVELLFSRQPFVQQDSDKFSIVRPIRSDVVELPAGKRELSVNLPPEYASSNVLVGVSAGGIRRARAVYAHRLTVQAIEAYGQVRVRSRDTGKPVPSTYVKTFARTKSGEVRFHKDGYTDLRGYFDYATISTGDLADVDKFALLVVHDELGALIKEASPPKR